MIGPQDLLEIEDRLQRALKSHVQAPYSEIGTIKSVIAEDAPALIAEVRRLRDLLAAGHKLVLPLQWLDDHGRECAWCEATIHGTPAGVDSRTNHRANCAWLSFVRRAEALL